MGPKTTKTFFSLMVQFTSRFVISSNILNEKQKTEVWPVIQNRTNNLFQETVFLFCFLVLVFLAYFDIRYHIKFDCDNYYPILMFEGHLSS